MKKQLVVILAIITLFYTGCLVPGSPHIDYYKPVSKDFNKILYKDVGFDRVFYKFTKNDSIQIFISSIVSSLPKTKRLFINMKLINQYKNKKISFYSDSLQIISNRFFADLKKQTNKNKYLINPQDSIFLVYHSKAFRQNDFKWYGKMKKKDTIFIKFYLDNVKYKIPFYFNKKNRLETYPF